MQPPRTLKEIQGLNGKLAALDPFLAKSTKKLLSLFKTLKGFIDKKDFYLTQEADEAFIKLKESLK